MRRVEEARSERGEIRQPNLVCEAVLHKVFKVLMLRVEYPHDLAVRMPVFPSRTRVMPEVMGFFCFQSPEVYGLLLLCF